MWIARDKDGELYLYTHKPIRCSDREWDLPPEVDDLEESTGLCEISSPLYPSLIWESEPLEVEIIKGEGMNLWVARERSSEIWVYPSIPERAMDSWRCAHCGPGFIAFPLREDLFPEVTWNSGPLQVCLVRKPKIQKKRYVGGEG